jgi:HAMP domain-containing protein
MSHVLYLEDIQTNKSAKSVVLQDFSWIYWFWITKPVSKLKQLLSQIKISNP